MASALPGAAAAGIRWLRIHRLTLALVVLASLAGLSDGVPGVEEGTAGRGGSRSFEMEMVHKYSQRFRELTKGRPGWEHMASEDWPRQGTAEFYHKLAMEDRHRHAARNLLAATDVYSLSPSNATYYLRGLGSIHYTLIALGTPAKEFLVALDTGSDLLWVPCDCQQCSSASWASYGLTLDIDFAIYSPSNSTTSKSVACNSAICRSSLSPGACNASAPQSCTYLSQYLSVNTSSKGTLVQDVVHLNPETGVGSDITADIYFGCGTFQTGDFLTGGAPNGLFGLGPEAYSVPSTLASNSVIKNVFSMCFTDPSKPGRLVFGKKPAASLQSTPLVPVQPSVYHVVGLQAIEAGGRTLNVSTRAIFDTGTSLTTFPSDIAQRVGDALGSQTTLESFSYTHSQTLLFTHCWNATTRAEVESLSSLSMTLSGGGTWPIMNTLVGVSDTLGNLLFICLGIVASEALNAPPIIGFNFMEGYEYFFDMENSTLSWVPSDCSSLSATNTTTKVPVSAPSPSPSSSSTSPSRTEAPPANSGIPVPSTAVLQRSKAHTSSSRVMPFQILSLLAFTVFFRL